MKRKIANRSKKFQKTSFPEKKPKKKKQFGQHFLRRQSVVDHMIERVELDRSSSIMEIGCGDGFLTRSLLSQTSAARIWCFEIDPQWAHYVQSHTHDPRLSMFITDILDYDWKVLEAHAPWTLLANLPYQITFPLLHRIQQHAHLFKEGVVMIQEEVAQKLVAKRGRSYGFPSLFFQAHFELELLDRVPPEAFVPPPAIYSRLIYFRPRKLNLTIENEVEFWEFIKRCFKAPRRTLRNNLQSYSYNLSNVESETLSLRAQQLSLNQFVELWGRLQI